MSHTRHHSAMQYVKYDFQLTVKLFDTAKTQYLAMCSMQVRLWELPNADVKGLKGDYWYSTTPKCHVHRAHTYIGPGEPYKRFSKLNQIIINCLLSWPRKAVWLSSFCLLAAYCLHYIHVLCSLAYQMRAGCIEHGQARAAFAANHQSTILYV